MPEPAPVVTPPALPQPLRFLVSRHMLRQSLLLFLKAATGVFVLSLVLHWINPRVAGLALNRIMHFYQHHFDFLQKVLSDLSFIFLNNTLAVLVIMGLGSLAVWWILGPDDDLSEDQLHQRAGASGWFSEVILQAVHRLAGRVHPHLRQMPCPALQRTVAVAVLPPVLALTINGALMGVWSAWYLTRTEWSGLGKAVLGILPHGVIELPAIWAAGASGLYIAGALIQAGYQGPDGVRQSLRALLRSQALWRTLAVFILMIATAATLETRVSWELQETLLAQG